MQAKKKSFVIGVAGASGSGKTTLCKEIVREIGEDKIAVLPHDAYYRDQSSKSFEERVTVNYDHPDSLETELLIQHIHHLRAGTAIDLPVYDYKLHTRAPETVRIEPKPIILVEGILIFAEPSLRKLFDMKLFVDTEQELFYPPLAKRRGGTRTNSGFDYRAISDNCSGELSGVCRTQQTIRGCDYPRRGYEHRGGRDGHCAAEGFGTGRVIDDITLV